MSKTKKVQTGAKEEAVYTVSELAHEAKRIFGGAANADCVTAAFKVSGKECASVSEAKKIVAAFMKKEVK